ncbi:MAG: hypothetical protein ABIS51_14175 [Sphingomonas sp.]
MFGRKGERPAPNGDSVATESPLTREIKGILSRSAGQHALDVAARLTSLFSTSEYDGNKIEFIAIRNIDHPCVCDLSGMEGDPVGLSFSFFGEAGESGIIYLTTKFGQLAPQGADPGPRVPAEMISRFVNGYEEAIRKLVLQRTPQRSPEELAQEKWIKSQLSQFLG